VPGLRKTDIVFKKCTRSVGVIDVTGPVYEFPPLDVCRTMFAKMMQQDFDWGDGPEEWTQEPPPDAPDDGGL
jgi:hypothetical protein